MKSQAHASRRGLTGVAPAPAPQASPSGRCSPPPAQASTRALLAPHTSAPARRSPLPGPRALASALLVALLAGACGPPTVDARAVWIASRRGHAGARTLGIYDAGSFSERALVPAAPGPDADALPLIVEFDPRGQGVLVRAADGDWQHDLGDITGRLRAGFVDIAGERTVPLALPANQAPSAVAFAAAGGALWWTEGCPAALALVPLDPRAAVAVEPASGAVAPLLLQLPRGCAEAWGAVSAADAPVLFALEGAPEDMFLRPFPDGHVVAVSYPTALGAGEAPALRPLRAARLPSDPLVRLNRARCAAPGPSCGLGVVDPDGQALTVGSAGADCRLWRWDVGEPDFVCVAGPDAPSWVDPARLIAALAPDTYLFREGLVIRRFHWRTGLTDGRPLIGDLSELFVRASLDGRAYLFLTIDGPALRVDADGLQLLSAEQRPCSGFQPPVASPSATFVAWTCTTEPEPELGVDGAVQLGFGEIVRVSAAGMQRFQGVPMWALAIDDDGDILLHSRDDTNFSLELLLPPEPPRNLYVLSADGELARVDPLEPDPELTRGLGPAVYRWIAAHAP